MMKQAILDSSQALAVCEGGCNKTGPRLNQLPSYATRVGRIQARPLLRFFAGFLSIRAGELVALYP
jgi:hypothetical protein